MLSQNIWNGGNLRHQEGIQMIDAVVSDLFFNVDHPRYDSLFDELKPPPDAAAVRAAIIEDAAEFLDEHGNELPAGISSLMLAQDCFRRL